MNIVVIAAFLIAGEIWLRVTTTHIVEVGDDEIAIPKPQNEFRVLMLGDSITVGDYLDAPEVFVERA